MTQNVILVLLLIIFIGISGYIFYRLFRSDKKRAILLPRKIEIVEEEDFKGISWDEKLNSPKLDLPRKAFISTYIEHTLNTRPLTLSRYRKIVYGVSK